MRNVGIIVLWFGIGLAVTDLLAQTIEWVVMTAPMRELLAADGRATNPVIARTDIAAGLLRRP